MDLNFKTIGEGKDLIILHGLFGSLDNWQTLAKYWAKDYKVWLVDQRNHGKSPHSSEFSYELMSNDLEEFVAQNHIEKPIILGHSMGGKTAMEFAVNNPNKMDKLIVVDIAPVKYKVHHYDVIEALDSVNLDLLSKRTEADEALKSKIDDIGVRQFLMKNLQRNKENTYSWKFNLDSIKKNILPISEFDISDKVYTGETLFVKGGESEYILDEYDDLIYEKFPQARIETIKSAGHWVHAEKPEQFFILVSDFMKD